MLAGDFAEYRSSESEQARTNDLLRLATGGRRSILDIGAREGYYSRLLAKPSVYVTALDLEEPRIDHPGVTTVAGDVTDLQFPDNSFDCVFCVEVLEHVPQLEQACREIIRVARHEIIIGVPYKQDLRIARTLCRTCGKRNLPWGHVNSFDEERLRRLFAPLPLISKSFVGSTVSAMNPISSWLLDTAGNPWGTYGQAEPCIHCGARLIPPPAKRSLWSKGCSFTGTRLTRLQERRSKPHPNWVHVVFSKSKQHAV